ncbi:hypothetical protein M885DRAFT_512331 [Pelagophyceae sp. CCMP2097]|nr:hypothetical protein M885DRAFT_512331 [Pelagophyceae sp. CCMP2097]
MARVAAAWVMATGFAAALQPASRATRATSTRSRLTLAAALLSADQIVGNYELEEDEDADSCKSLMEMRPDGGVVLGATSGVPFVSQAGSWALAPSGDEIRIVLEREYESNASRFTLTRFLVGDVVDGLWKLPATFTGRIQATESDDAAMPQIQGLANPNSAMGYFIALKIPDAPEP